MAPPPRRPGQKGSPRTSRPSRVPSARVPRASAARRQPARGPDDPARPGRTRLRAGRAQRDARGGDGQRRRPTALTGRAAVLALVVCTLAISFAYPVRQYVEQRSQINALEEQRDAKSQRVAELERAKRRWQDPAYIRAQARERLHFVLPGETGYVAVGGNQHAPDPEPQDERADVPTDQQPWFSRLWNSVQDSAGPDAGPDADRRG